MRGKRNKKRIEKERVRERAKKGGRIIEEKKILTSSGAIMHVG